MPRIILKNCRNIFRCSNPQFHGILTTTSFMRKSPFQRIAGVRTYRLIKCSNLICAKLCKLISIDCSCRVICTICSRYILAWSCKFYLMIACRCLPRNGTICIRHSTIPVFNNNWRFKASVLNGRRQLTYLK